MYTKSCTRKCITVLTIFTTTVSEGLYYILGNKEQIIIMDIYMRYYVIKGVDALGGVNVHHTRNLRTDREGRGLF